MTRAISILRLLGKSETSLGVNAIANALGLVPSTCLHILRVLVAEGLVAFNPVGKQYRLDAGVLTLARSILRRKGINALVQPALDQMAKKYPVTAVAVQLVGLDHIVVVAISGSQLDGRIHVEIGGRFPALMSATGRCIAAFGPYSQIELEQQLTKIRWDRAPSLSSWNADVKAVRRLRYSVDNGNYISGVTVIAAPILDDAERMTHALVVVGVSKQIDKNGVVKIATGLRSLAEDISRRNSVLGA